MTLSQSGSIRRPELYEPEPVVRMRFKPQAQEPKKVRVGDVVYANGTTWNPGDGEGLYVRLSTGWVKL